MMVRSILHRLIAATLALTIIAGAFSSAIAARMPVSPDNTVPAAAASHICPVTASLIVRATNRVSGAHEATIISANKGHPGDLAMRGRCFGCNLEPTSATDAPPREYLPALFIIADSGADDRNPFSLLKPPRL